MATSSSFKSLAGTPLITGLSRQPNTPQWWIDFGAHGVFNVSDAIGAHVYWPDRASMLTQAQGLNFIPLVPMSSATKPIYITEYCNNVGSDADYDKGKQYVEWWNFILANYPTVTRAYLYIISSTTPAENDTRQTIVRGGVVSQIATGSYARLARPRRLCMNMSLTTGTSTARTVARRPL